MKTIYTTTRNIAVIAAMNEKCGSVPITENAVSTTDAIVIDQSSGGKREGWMIHGWLGKSPWL